MTLSQPLVPRDVLLWWNRVGLLVTVLGVLLADRHPRIGGLFLVLGAVIVIGCTVVILRRRHR